MRRSSEVLVPSLILAIIRMHPAMLLLFQERLHKLLATESNSAQCYPLHIGQPLLCLSIV